MVVDPHRHAISLYHHRRCLGRDLQDINAIMDILGAPTDETEVLVSLAWDIVTAADPLFPRSVRPSSIY